MAAQISPNAINNLWNFNRKSVSRKVSFDLIASVWLKDGLKPGQAARNSRSHQNRKL